MARFTSLATPARFIFFRGRGAEREALAALGVAPHALVAAVGVLFDHRVRGIENDLGAAVVLLEAHFLAAGKEPLEVENVAHLGAAPRIDALVVVAHHADVVVRVTEVAQQLELRLVGVLVLVDHDVAKALRVRGLHLGKLLEDARGEDDQIVEVDRAPWALRPNW